MRRAAPKKRRSRITLGDREYEIASFRRRFCAWAIDFVGGTYASAIALVLALGASGDYNEQAPQAGGLAFVIFGYPPYLAISNVLGATLAQYALGLRVVGLDGKRPGIARGLLRSLLLLVPIVLGPLSLVVYGWALWDPERQGVHDEATDTHVIRVRAMRRAP